MSDSQKTDPKRWFEAEFERSREAWSAWLSTLATFSAETDPVRASELAAEVERSMPSAVRARLVYLELLPLEIRRRELAVTPMRFAHAAAALAQVDMTDVVVPDYVRKQVEER